MAKLKLAAPWTTYYREIQAMFKEDKEVRVIFDENAVAIKLYVDNAVKAQALTTLLPETVSFGNVILKLIIIPSNINGQEVVVGEFKTHAEMVQAAFTGNTAIVQFYPVEGVFTNNMLYVVFKKEVVQFFNDDLSDIRGMCSTLYANLAKDLFGDLNGVFFCTDSTVENFGMPLGEWP